MRSTKCRYSETVADGDVRIRPVVGPQSPPEHHGDAADAECDVQSVEPGQCEEAAAEDAAAEGEALVDDELVVLVGLSAEEDHAECERRPEQPQKPLPVIVV